MLYRALTEAADCKEAQDILEREGFQVDYVEDHWERRFAAAFLGGVRLIDNVPLPGTTRRSEAEVNKDVAHTGRRQ